MWHDISVRVVRAGLAVTLGLAGLSTMAAGDAPRNDPADVPVVRSTTVIRATGHAGTRIVIPDGVRLEDNDVTLEVTDSAYGFAGLSDRACPDPEQLCLNVYVFTFPERGSFFPMSTRTPDGGLVPASVYDVYLLTDGTAELTLRFKGAPDGLLEIDADGRIDGHVEQLTPRCLEGDDGQDRCLDTAYGSATHTVTAPAFAAAVAYTYREGPGTGAVESCLDPHFGTTPSGAASSRYGCPISPTDESWNPGSTSRIVLGSTPTPTEASISTSKFNHSPDGEVYVGFIARDQSPTTEGGYAGFGFWLNGGITFPP